jgi:pimeloyl-ACP methyl ester carboxylesterase/DNA-binding winged helix-turn-helix (wHTH) protein
VQFSFDDYVLDIGRRELLWAGVPVAVEPQVFDLLAYLVQHRHRVVTRDDLIESVWSGRIVSESTLASRINAARKAIGDNGRDQRLIRTANRKGLRFVGTISESVGDPAATASVVPDAATTTTALRQEVRFCMAPDGTRIAYAEIGQGLPLVKAANWLSHLEYDWESPVWAHLWHALAANYRLVRYDQRGNGLSDWQVDNLNFDSMVDDLEAVVDAAGLRRFALLGVSQGCAISIAYAVRHPERVSQLVLYGGFARGLAKRAEKGAIEQFQALATLIELGWGNSNPAFRQVFTSQFVPGGTLEQIQWFNDLQRFSTSPQNAKKIFEVTANMDVTDLLPRVRVPTLVLHCRHDARVPFESGRAMAAAIPGARFVALEGQNHVILETDPGRARFLEEVGYFLESDDGMALADSTSSGARNRVRLVRAS